MGPGATTAGSARKFCHSSSGIRSSLGMRLLHRRAGIRSRLLQGGFPDRAYGRRSEQAGTQQPSPALRYIRLVRYFLRRRHPPVSRILLVESGSRRLIEGLLPSLRANYGERVPIDLVTCFPGAPEVVSAVYRVSDYRGGAARGRLYRSLAANRYAILGIVCSDERIMTRWKWVLAARLPAKVFVINENGDYFWLDWGHWRFIRHFVLYRAGLSGSGAVRTLGRLLLFPFTLAFLLLYATVVHFKRAVRLRGVLRRGYR